VVVFLISSGTHRRSVEKRAAMGGSIEEEELNDEVAEKIADLLLLRLVPAQSREVAGIAGKQRRSGAPACSGKLGRGH
jgi:hypothetical protein